MPTLNEFWDDFKERDNRRESEKQPERDWQEDWEHVEIMRHGKTLCNIPLPIKTMHGEIRDDTDVLAYWLQDVKQLRERVISLEIDARYWKGKYLTACEETAREKQRANDIKEKYDSLMLMLKEATEVMTWRNTGDGVDQGIKMIYRWLLERSPESKSDKL
ncbi:hypothetical protein [Paenibacillus taiwanensis]|uniref:hypothetical protein n=1 Tax=Paenibacillus taiwanensis TaxID=401638 RepID=UPI00040E10B0|nr:hypothetical protein [Paenibacillus taiwanensis]